MRSTKEKMLMLQKELILYSSNLEKAIDQKDQYHIIYYDVLLQITWKKLEQIYSKYVDEEEVIVTPFCNQIAKSLLEREAHLQDEDYLSFIRLFVDEVMKKEEINNYQVLIEPMTSFGEVELQGETYLIHLSSTHLKDINIRFNIETIFMQVLKIKQMKLKKNPCKDCYQILKKKKINLIQKYYPYYFYDFDFYEDSPLELYTSLAFYLYVSKVSPKKRKELEREIRKKMEQYKIKMPLERLKSHFHKFQYNSYDLLFEEHILEFQSVLEEEPFSLEYQLQGKRRTLLDIFLSQSKLKKLMERESTSEENKERAQYKIQVLNEMIEKGDFSTNEITDVIQFLFTSCLLDKNKQVDENLFYQLIMKYQHMLTIFWYSYPEEYVRYLNLLKEIEQKLVLQVKKNKQLALKDYQRYLENEKQFQEHIQYFKLFREEMNQYFVELEQVISL